MTRGIADARTDLDRLAGRPLEAAELSHEVNAALESVLDFDGWCVSAWDPHTGLRTAQIGGAGTEHTAEMARNEAVMADVNRYTDLASRPVPVGWLSAQHPQADTSFRLNEILIPQGFRSELRMALRHKGRVWGTVSLFRAPAGRDLSDADGEVLYELADPLTRVLRAFPVRPLPRRGTPPGAGLVTVSPDDDLTVVTDEAVRWLEDLVPGGEDQTWYGDVTRIVFEVAHAVRRGDLEGARTCIRTVSGHWMRVEGLPMASESADVAVVLRPATVQELVGPLATYRGLTARETEILTLLTYGLATKQIARELALSTLTVSTHLRSLYRKCGVAGREELLGSLV